MNMIFRADCYEKTTCFIIDPIGSRRFTILPHFLTSRSDVPTRGRGQVGGVALGGGDDFESRGEGGVEWIDDAPVG